MRYIVHDEKSGAMIDVYLKVVEPLLLQFAQMTGTQATETAELIICTTRFLI